jgi:hypothetical protein
MTLRSSKTIAKNIPVTIDRIETWIEVDSTDSKFAMTGLCEHQAGPPSFSITDPIDFSVFNKFHPHFITNMKKMWSPPLLEAILTAFVGYRASKKAHKFDLRRIVTYSLIEAGKATT